MSRLSTPFRVVIGVLVIGALAYLSSGGGASWAAPEQDTERQTVPTRTPVPPPTSPPPTSPPPTSPPSTSQPPTSPSPTLPSPTAATTSPSPTPTTATPITVTVITDTNVFNGPGTDYEVVGSLKAGDNADVLGRNADSSWWQIRFKGGKAWIADAVVDANPEAYKLSVVSAPSLRTGSPTPSALPDAGGGPLIVGGSALLLANGALLLLAGKLARRRRR